MYHGQYSGSPVLILRQVDDFNVAADNPDIAKQIYDKINHYCTLVQEDGPVKLIYGVDILQTRDYIQLHLRSYLQSLMSDYPFLHNIQTTDQPCSPLPEDLIRKTESTTAPDTLQLRLDLEKQMGFSYRSLLGKLMFAMICGRFDIAYAMSKLAQHGDNPTAAHYRALRQLAMYLVQTRHRGIIYWRLQPRNDLPFIKITILPPKILHSSFPTTPPDGTLAGIHITGTDTDLIHPSDSDLLYHVHGFTDSDHASDITTRRSHTGSVITLDGSLIDFNSKLQVSVTLSSCEAELVALVDTAKRLRCIRQILRALSIPINHATPLYCDNAAAIKVSTATGTTKRLRHVDIRHFAIQEWTRSHELTVLKVHTSQNPADLCTKALDRKLHTRHMLRLMGYYGRQSSKSNNNVSSILPSQPSHLQPCNPTDPNTQTTILRPTHTNSFDTDALTKSTLTVHSAHNANSTHITNHIPDTAMSLLSSSF